MHRALNRRATVLVGLTAALMTAAACTPAPTPVPIATPGVEPTGTVELWHFFTDREAKTLDETLAKFTAKYPKVTLTVKGGQDDAKVTTAIGAGTGPDVAISYSTDIVGKFCAAGAWTDLNPYIQRDHIDLNAIPAVARFLGVQAGSSGLHTAGVWILTRFGRLPYPVSKLVIAAFVYLTWNYPLNRWFVFRRHPTSRMAGAAKR